MASTGAYGLASRNGKLLPFGYFSVIDWLYSVLLSFPRPWSIASLDGKYYGTVILDADQVPILSCWQSGEPSDREKARFGCEWTVEAWGEYCTDSHYESRASLNSAKAIVELANGCTELVCDTTSNRTVNNLMAWVFQFGRWKPEVWSLIQCGGSRKRLLEDQIPEEEA